MERQNKILVVGFGSDILTDDDISARLIRDVELSDIFPNIYCCSFLTSSMDLIESLCDYKSLILIDAMKSNKYHVGKLKRLQLEEVGCTLHLSNFHDHGFSEILQTARKCGFNISTDVYVYGIEIEESHVFSTKLSENLQNAYLDLRQEIIEVIHQQIESLKKEIAYNPQNL